MDTISSEVVVIGGGPSGISAAIAAKKIEAKVLLIEKNGFLGGTPVSGRIGAFCGFYTSESPPRQIVKGVANEMLENMKKEDAIYGPVNLSGMVALFYDLPVLKTVLDGMVTSSGIDVLMHSLLVESEVDNGTITSVKASSKSGPIKVEGKVFIDATGDADLAYLSGAKCDKSQELQPGSIMYRVGNVDMKKATAFTSSGKLREAIKTANSSGEFYISRHDGFILPTPRSNEAVIALSHIPVDATDVTSLTKAELKAYTEVSESFRFLKSKVPGFENAYILDIASSVGIRETRRLVGQYVLKEDDVLSGAKFDDGICRCAWPIELHIK
jgi:ribulose 1,5-bisphosphate synthetase/thiazole synthase